jgi:hypothetical protein
MELGWTFTKKLENLLNKTNFKSRDNYLQINSQEQEMN